MKIFKGEFSSAEAGEKWLPWVGIMHRILIVRAIPEATILARRLGLPEPSNDTLAHRIADLDANSGAARLLSLLQDGNIYVEDQRSEIVHAFALLELAERRSQLDRSDPNAVRALGVGWYQCYTTKERKAA